MYKRQIITKLHEEGVEFLSTGGTRQFIESLGYPCKAVEDLTTYPVSYTHLDVYKRQHSDSAIFNSFDGEEGSAFRCSATSQKTLRYGENPHQKGYVYGNIDAMFDQIHGRCV